MQKKTKLKLVNYRLPVEVAHAIQKAANLQGRSQTNYMVNLLRTVLNIPQA